MLFVMGPTMPMSGALLRHSSIPDSQFSVTTTSLFKSRIYSPVEASMPLVTAPGESKVLFIFDQLIM